jgi:uncharacterized circularly permuted ATP-grasp superfamily protein/uncharacterized alpha-E superfamily protein
MSKTESDLLAGPSLFEGYRPATDSFDELLDAGGTPRGHWRPLLEALQRLTPDELRTRRESTRRILREHGATYNVYSDSQGQGRPWSLDLLPMVIPDHEWRDIEAGLIQRSRLLNCILQDIYGPQELLRLGRIPPALLYANPGFLRPGHGIRPVGGNFLFLHAVDVARAPDGRWWALADRTQAPSGAGYALENRLVLSRILPDEFRNNQVSRLPGFFQQARESLLALAPPAARTPRAVVLTPGPYNETYFEQVFLSRYLGFPLVEGGDLTVRNDRVFIKTLEGLQPVDVILRRMDDSYCDPLELRGDSSLGVPGLVEATRAGTVTVANAFGSGAVEVPAFLAFLPRLCRELLGEELRLPSVATWWCGAKTEFDYVQRDLSHLVIKRAFISAAADDVSGDTLDARSQAALLAAMRTAPYDFVAQERMSLSSVPILEKSGLEPRPCVMRLFVCATPTGYAVMPGALTRYSTAAESLGVSMQSGGGSKDTWILAENLPPPANPLRHSAHLVRLERTPAEVPSRVADNLYWLGRYLERLEDSTRILRCVLLRLTGETGAEETPELSALIRLLVELEMFPAKFKHHYRLAGVEREIHALISSAHRLGTLREIVGRVRSLAFVLRDRFSVDTWSILSGLQAAPRNGIREQVQPSGTLDLLNTLVVDLAAISGMEMENMTRGHGWRFLDLGRRLERGINMATSLQAAAAQGTLQSTVLEPLLEIADSSMTYRRRYFALPHWPGVLDLLLGDETNPRALAFQVQALTQHVENLPEGSALGLTPEKRGGPSLSSPAVVTLGMGNPRRPLATLSRLLRETDWLELITDDTGTGSPRLAETLAVCAKELRGMSDAVTHHYFSHAETRLS